jgi:hypothetical protein
VEDVRLAAFTINAGVGFGGEIAGLTQTLDLRRFEIVAGDGAQIIYAQAQVVEPLVIYR